MDRVSSLFRPVDAASLAVFRIGFGIIMMWEVWRYFARDFIGRYFVAPEFHFKYYGFEWVEVWPGDGMYIHFAVVGVLAFLITIGLFYRLAIVGFTIGFAYIFLADQAYYLNHFYFVILLGILMCFLPANRCWSIDALLRKPATPAVPLWTIWLMRGQMEVMLLYAGLVKINSDWLNFIPLSNWLSARSDFPVIGHLFTEQWVVAIAAYGAIALHVIGAPLLLIRRTRLYVFVAYVAFHLNIG